jgi:steroid delta-isomerase-like uncharacterized protein
VSVEASKDVVRRSIEALNAGELSGYMDLVSHDYVHHDATAPDATDGAALEQFLQGMMTAFPDASVTIEDLIAERDLVVKRYTVRGTHRGDFSGIPPTGNPVTFTGATVYRVQDGKFKEGWWNYDLFSILAQIGALPQPSQA